MILLYDEFQAYGQIKSIGLWLCALAAVIAGFRIYQNWNRGGDVEGPLVLWLTSIAFCGGAVYGGRSLHPKRCVLVFVRGERLPRPAIHAVDGH